MSPDAPDPAPPAEEAPAAEEPQQPRWRRIFGSVRGTVFGGLKSFGIGALSVLKRMLPRGLIGWVLKRRNAICISVVVAVGAIWILCGILFEEPKAYLTGVGLLFPVGMWLGYMIGARFGKKPPPADAPPAEGAEEAPAAPSGASS